MSSSSSSQKGGGRFRLDFGFGQHIGRRPSQQDYISCNPAKPTPSTSRVLCVMADGMGGLSGGDIASKVCGNAFIQKFSQIFESGAQDVHTAMMAAMDGANKTLGERKANDPQYSDMGCTLCCAYVEGDKLHILSVGDSYIYLIRKGVKQEDGKTKLIPVCSIYQRNELHNMREELKRQGREWRNVPNASGLTSYMDGQHINRVHCYMVPQDLQPGDSVIVASDGILTLSPKEILQALRPRKNRTAQQAVDAALQQILSKGNPRQDNVSIGLIHLVEN